MILLFFCVLFMKCARLELQLRKGSLRPRYIEYQNDSYYTCASSARNSSQGTCQSHWFSMIIHNNSKRSSQRRSLSSVNELKKLIVEKIFLKHLTAIVRKPDPNTRKVIKKILQMKRPLILIVHFNTCKHSSANNRNRINLTLAITPVPIIVTG